MGHKECGHKLDNDVLQYFTSTGGNSASIKGFINDTVNQHQPVHTGMHTFHFDYTEKGRT